jgi:hypothetical protein
LNDARAASPGPPHTRPESIASSVARSPLTPGDPSQPPVLPRVLPTKPPRFPTQTPTKLWTRAYPRDVARFQALVRRFARNGLVPSTGIDLETGRRVGGRPPVVAEAFRALLDNAEATFLRPRASNRSDRGRRVDDAARVGFGRLFRAFPTRLLPYRPSVERVVGHATGADRPQRRIAATVDFCDRRLIAGFSVGNGRPARMDLVLPTMVPDLYYGWGPTVYQTTLDGDGSVAA